MQILLSFLFVLSVISESASAASDIDFTKQVDRIRTKAMWLLDNPSYDVADDANARFNSRRCMRVVTEMRAAIGYANHEGLPVLSLETIDRFKRRAIGTIRKVVYQNPVRWYVPFNPGNPIEKTLEMSEMTACLGVALKQFDTEIEADLRSDLVGMLVTLIERYRASYEPLIDHSLGKWIL